MKKALFLPFALALLSCGEHSLWEDFDLSNALGELRTGWLASDENLSLIPQDIASFAGNASNLPDRFLLEDKFPPIGDQGQYGTCVAWAVGYNLKTALNGIDKNWSSSDLERTSNQTSPKDLWMTIPAGEKNENCGGTAFESALDAMISKGASSLSSVPYSNMGNCSGTSNGDISNNLANYRKIAYNERLSGGSRVDGMDVSNFKGYLSQGRPIVIGAKLGDRFMRWNSSSVISSDTYNDPNMQHAYHAMVLSGYDDSKNAFRVRNSWGSWGDKGSIWVDYDFFLNDFCFVAVVAQNPPAPPPNNNQLLSDFDLFASFAEDSQDPESNSLRDRVFSYDIYNNGSLTIEPSQRWSVLYMYYNAYDANEYEIIYEDYYTDEFKTEHGAGGKCDESSDALAGCYWNYAFLEPGAKAGDAEYEYGFEIPYTMPDITGDYYLVVFADAYEKIQESNEENNFYFIAAKNGKPLKFANGIMQSAPANAAAKSLGKKLPRDYDASSVAKLGELNGYTPQEIKSLLKRDRQSGKLAKKVAEFRNNNTASVKIPRKK